MSNKNDLDKRFCMKHEWGFRLTNILFVLHLRLGMVNCFNWFNITNTYPFYIINHLKLNLNLLWSIGSLYTVWMNWYVTFFLSSKCSDCIPPKAWFSFFLTLVGSTVRVNISRETLEIQTMKNKLCMSNSAFLSPNLYL